MNLKELLGEAYKEGMTFEEVENVLAGIELPKPDSINSEKEIARYKNAISEANKKTAEYKRLLQAKQSEEEQKAQADAEERERILKENEEFKKQIAISDNVNALVGIGYDPELAKLSAEAMFNGDMKTVIENQKSFIESKQQQILSDAMSDTPKPAIGASGKGTKTREEIMSIKDTTERQAAIAENPELFGLDMHK